MAKRFEVAFWDDGGLQNAFACNEEAFVEIAEYLRVRLAQPSDQTVDLVKVTQITMTKSETESTPAPYLGVIWMSCAVVAGVATIIIATLIGLGISEVVSWF